MDGERQLGRWKLFTGRTEIMVHSNLQVVDIMQGQHGAVWELIAAAAVMRCR